MDPSVNIFESNTEPKLEKVVFNRNDMYKTADITNIVNYASITTEGRKLIFHITRKCEFEPSDLIEVEVTYVMDIILKEEYVDIDKETLTQRIQEAYLAKINYALSKASMIISILTNEMAGMPLINPV